MFQLFSPFLWTGFSLEWYFRLFQGDEPGRFYKEGHKND